MLATASGARLDVERGPDCLFLRLNSVSGAESGEFSLAEEIWALLDQHFTYRLVLDLSPIRLLNSRLVGQLIALARRVCAHEGMIRLCGLSAYNKEVLDRCRLGDRLPTYSDREEAVFAGRRPRQPR